MKVVAIAVALLCLAAIAIADEEKKDSDVIVLDDDNWDTVVPKHDLLLVEFYAPWCGHCKALAPEYEQAATELKKDGLFIAKYDADSQKKKGGQYGVSGFPTLKFFRSGALSGDYEGERKAAGIVKFMKQKAAQSVNQEITSTDALQKLTKAKFVTKTILIGFFADLNSVDYKYWKEVVMSLAESGLEIYYVTKQEVMENFGFYGSGSSISMYRPNGKPFKVTYRGTLFKQTLKEWIADNAIPVVSHYSPESHKLYGLTGKHVLRILTKKGSSDQVDVKGLTEVAEKFPGVHFATADAEDYKDDVEAHCGSSGAVCVLATEGQPFKTKRTFGMENGYSKDNLIAFVEKFLAKQLTVKVKSEPAGPEPKAGEVAKLVGTTFKSLVIDSNKDVFIKFYAPWCGHCKALAPKFEELAKSMADEFDNILISDLDLTANDLPEEYKGSYEVGGFPTMYFALKGKKGSPLKYEGAREAADMKTWLLEKRSK